MILTGLLMLKLEPTTRTDLLKAIRGLVSLIDSRKLIL